MCLSTVEQPEQFYQSGESFGQFLKRLENYPAENLHETIPDFHNTVKRFENFKVAVKRDLKNRADSCKKEISFVEQRQEDSRSTCKTAGVGSSAASCYAQ